MPVRACPTRPWTSRAIGRDLLRVSSARAEFIGAIAPRVPELTNGRLQVSGAFAPHAPPGRRSVVVPRQTTARYPPTTQARRASSSARSGRRSVHAVGLGRHHERDHAKGRASRHKGARSWLNSPPEIAHGSIWSASRARARTMLSMAPGRTPTGRCAAPGLPRWNVRVGEIHAARDRWPLPISKGRRAPQPRASSSRRPQPRERCTNRPRRRPHLSEVGQPAGGVERGSQRRTDFGQQTLRTFDPPMLGEVGADLHNGWGSAVIWCHANQRLDTVTSAPSRRVWTSSPFQWPVRRTSASIAAGGWGNRVCAACRLLAQGLVAGPPEQLLGAEVPETQSGPACRRLDDGVEHQVQEVCLFVQDPKTLLRSTHIDTSSQVSRNHRGWK